MTSTSFRRYVLFAWVALVGSDLRGAEPTPADWAFRPVLAPAVPPVKSAGPIDAFLLTQLESQKLGFSPRADRSTLLRRVTFDLIGLPPTPEEIAAFQSDTTPNAFEKVVDRLLESPRYGERAALFWLDLVRFAETDGFKADDTRPNAWRYRDYVIESFNADKPFDRFIREQIAGDELYPNDPRALVATGFLRHYPDEYNAVNLEQRRQEILNDITDTAGATFLGVTLGCCRCHDHKTDPIAQKDYYRIQSFFAGYNPVEVPVDPKAAAEYDGKLAAWKSKTEAIRAKMTDIEKPHREKAEAKERFRFQVEHSRLIDLPPEKLTPLERQLAAMASKQVYSDKRFAPTMLKGDEKKNWDAHAKELAAFDADKPKPPAMIHAMTDLGRESPPTHNLKRGDWRKPDGVIEPAFLSKISTIVPKLAPTATTPGRRTALANWIAGADNPLTARVMVNRIWQQHFGKGIVASSSDLGQTGDRPTHPELLDWLALEFVKSGWSVKYLHKVMVLTQAYRQGSEGSAESMKLDPENRRLGHFPRRRLDGEALRDACLAVSGQLNLKAGGPSIFPDVPAELKGSGWKPSADIAERNRRSIYVFVKRNLRYPMFALFDSPDRSESCSRRFVTTTAPQALALLNDPTMLSFAQSLAQRVMKEAGPKPEAQVERLFALTLGRKPTTEESAALTDFLQRHKGTPTDALVDLGHTVFNLNEFLYVD